MPNSKERNALINHLNLIEADTNGFIEISNKIKKMMHMGNLTDLEELASMFKGGLDAIKVLKLSRFGINEVEDGKDI